MPDPNVWEVGRVEPEGEPPVVVGVDYDEVSIRASGSTLSPSECEELAQLLSRATWEAGKQAYELQQEARITGVRVPPP